MNTTSNAMLAKYGPWALVTGATEGIGREFALQLAEQGFNLFLVARREGLLADLSQFLRDRDGIHTEYLALDLGLMSSLPALVAASSRDRKSTRLNSSH